MSAYKTFSEAIRSAIVDAMDADANVICYGLGVPDPKGVFGTTTGLQKRFGPQRVFDTPTSENAMTGVGIGAALNGIRSVMTHQRLDFFLLAMDQLVNNAAKWQYMFGGAMSVPITIRLILGRGWGQGPTHSQNLQSWLAHVPGLKIMMPCFPSEAYHLLREAIEDSDPVVFLEHRWLHQTEEKRESTEIPTMGRAVRVREGKDLTIVSSSYMTLEALRAADWLTEQGIQCEIINWHTLRPMDWTALQQSIAKTGRLLALETGNPICSVAGEIVARVSENSWDNLKCAPRRLTLPDTPSPTSPALTEKYYLESSRIATEVWKMVFENSLKEEEVSILSRKPHDIPGNWFKGPF